MSRFITRGGSVLALAMLMTGPALAAGWSTQINQGDSPAYHYAIAEGGTSNANIGALALECHVEGGGQVWQLQLYPVRPGPIAPKGTSPDDVVENGGYIAVDGKRFDVDPLGAGDYLALSDTGAGGFAGISGKVVEAIAAGTGILEISLDMVPDKVGPANRAYESTAVFALEGAGAAIAAAKAACR